MPPMNEKKRARLIWWMEFKDGRYRDWLILAVIALLSVVVALSYWAIVRPNLSP
jgi:hypothetical protein